MKRKTSFHFLAERELNEAARYYNLKSPGLGNAFVSEVERALSSILENPEAAPAIRGRVRRKLIHRFPYCLLYSVVAEEVRVLAIMNQKRRPFYWRQRE